MNIHTALQLHSEVHIQTFLKTSKNMNVRDASSQTPLHIAAAQGLVDVVKRLLKKKANVNLQDVNGWTPLHCAANEQFYQICHLLIQYKANLTLETKDEATPFAYACKGRKDGVKQVELLKLMLSKVPSLLDKSNYRAETPLSRACIAGSFEVIQYLIKNKANVNSQTSGGITCLHNAARSGRLDVFKLLLENGADHTIKNSEQLTPLEEAIEFGDKDIAVAIKYLISPGDTKIESRTVVAELVNVFNRTSSKNDDMPKLAGRVKISLPPVPEREESPSRPKRGSVKDITSAIESKGSSEEKLGIVSDPKTRPSKVDGTVQKETVALLELLDSSNIASLENGSQILAQIEVVKKLLQDTKTTKTKSRTTSTLRSLKGRLSTRSNPIDAPPLSKCNTPPENSFSESCLVDSRPVLPKRPPRPPPRKKGGSLSGEELPTLTVSMELEDGEEFTPKEILKSGGRRKTRNQFVSAVTKLIDETERIVTATSESEEEKYSEYDEFFAIDNPYLEELDLPAAREMQLTNYNNYPKEVQARQLPFEEILCTEIQYCRQLGAVIAYFIRPLQNQFEGIITQQELKTLFCNLEDIFAVTKKLLRELQEEATKSPEEQEIGALFISFKNEFSVYKPYCTSQGEATECLERLREENKLFEEYLIKTKENVDFLTEDLGGYIIKPFQRICRYGLLLKELLKQTPDSWKDRATLKEAVIATGSVVQQANETQRVMDNLIKIEQIQSKLDVQIEFKRAVTFLLEGDIKEAGQKRHFFLFNSLFVLVKAMRGGRWNNKYSFPVKNCLVWDTPDPDGHKYCFQIVRTDTTDKYTYECKSLAEKENYMTAFSDAIVMAI